MRAREGVHYSTAPMRTSSRRPLALVPGLLLLPVFALSCDPSPPPITQPDLPQVSIQLDEPNTVGTSLKFSIATGGCDSVAKLEVLDNDTLLKQVAFAGNPTPVELKSNELRYTRGLALNLSLVARVACADGRVNVSQAQAATFFPVAEVISPPGTTGQVVPTYFVAEGSGSSTTFIGCGREGTRSFLYRVALAKPNEPDRLEMPFECDASTVITDRKPAGTGWRWVWTPGKGAIAVAPNFTYTRKGNAELGEDVLRLVITPDGDALASSEFEFQRVSPENVVRWAETSSEVPGNLSGEPLVRTGTLANTFVVPALNQRTANVEVIVAVFDYTNGKYKSHTVVDTVTNSQSALTAFDTTGTVLYVATQNATSANVKACLISDARCQAGTPTSRQWISDELEGEVAAMVPYNNGSRLAVITRNRFWFLDARNGSSTAGKSLNKDGRPLSPSGALVARYAQQSLTGGAFYMFNSGAATTTNPNPDPIEIIATDEAEKGLLYRYQTPGTSLFGALDDSDTLWLRVGRKLVKPLTPQQYRQVL